jgi:hypothetical protein
VLNNVLCIVKKGFVCRGVWKKITPSVEWDEMRTVELNIFAKHIGHQLQNGGRTCKKDALKDE